MYRATDTNLKRQVAVKVLPPSVAVDADRLARFQREAEVLAALNHPNIAHIFSLEKADRTIALVMELVEGPTLADRIAHGAIALVDASTIARQIAEALEAAHAKGIIHRDLKPANIKVTSDGHVKLLDFGLAKAYGDEASGTAGHPSFSPTMAPAAGATAAGLILGTAAYMSPEQARGKLVDARTDIWAFGCVLPDTTPRAIRTLLRRCLQKDTHQRLHHVADARLAYVRRLESDEATSIGNINNASSALAMSPDGLSLALSGNDGTIRRAFLKDSVLAVVGGDSVSSIDWGGDRIAFTREGTLWQLPAAGGDAEQVTTLDKDRHETAQASPLFIPGRPIMLFSCWTERSVGPAHMEAVSLDGGKRRVVVERAVPVAYAPTGHLVFLRDSSLMSAPFDLTRLELTGSPVVVVENVATTAFGSANAALSQNGTLVYVRGGAAQSRLVWVSRQGLEQAIGDATQNFAMPRLTSDGRTAVVWRTGEGLRRYDVQQHTSTPLTIDEPRAYYPAATRDGALVIYL